MERDLAAVSWKLLGGEHRLALAIHLASAKAPVYTFELAEAMQVDKSQVSKDLAHFVDLGLLIKSRRVAGDRRRGYERVDNPLWDGLVGFAASLATPTPALPRVVHLRADRQS